MNKPTVTQLLELLNKPALMKWSNKIGLQGIKLDEYRTEAMNKGKVIHNQIDEYFRYNIPFEDAVLFENFKSFISDKKVIDTEKNIETDLFIGKYDMRIDFRGKEYICDFKSSSGIYLENILQLVCYKMAKEECEIAIVEIPIFKFKPITLRYYDQYKEIIQALHSIWKNKLIVE
jgi:hypothetical protein